MLPPSIWTLVIVLFWAYCLSLAKIRWYRIFISIAAGCFIGLVWTFPESKDEPEPPLPTPAQVCSYHKGIRNVDGDGYGILYVTCNDNYYQETWKEN